MAEVLQLPQWMRSACRRRRAVLGERETESEQGRDERMGELLGRLDPIGEKDKG
ncbi:hypothetical protein GQ55_7G188600 [Panicum hallii var. hallii]|uniref:Uncharacterized protein n=1 Tax=Panicum hallii var. hallii TaxID=1504633 RepID=A0A2T7CWX3_9POAL|nr:hypothetical protein GQ55_7G188600 [Panicum hallii var. hallii]